MVRPLRGRPHNPRVTQKLNKNNQKRVIPSLPLIVFGKSDAAAIGALSD